MLYTIGEISKRIGISPHTLRFYAKEGLLPFVERSDRGIRVFKESDFEWLYIIECLKKTGMSLKDIKIFVDWGMAGDETIDQRYAMFSVQRKKVEAQIVELKEALDVLKYKCWYYETAKAAGTLAVHDNMQSQDIPEEIRHVKEKTKVIHMLDTL